MIDEAIRQAAAALDALEQALVAEGFYLKHIMQHKPDGWIVGFKVTSNPDLYHTCASQPSVLEALLCTLREGRQPRTERPRPARPAAPLKAKDIDLDQFLKGLI